MRIYHSNLIPKFGLSVLFGILLGVLQMGTAYAFQNTGSSSYSLSDYSQSRNYHPQNYQSGHSGKSSGSSIAFKKSGQVIIGYGYHRPYRKYPYYGKHHKTHKKIDHRNRHHRASGHHHYKKKSYGIHLKSAGRRHYQSNQTRRYFQYKRNRYYLSHKHSHPQYGQKHQRYYQN